jgi:hypothetical protein
LLGVRSEHPSTRLQRALLLGEPPSAIRMQGRDSTELHDYYYWYYGALAAFQLGGETWERWNASLRDAILPLQERSAAGGRRSHAHGSWPPYGPRWGKWGRMGGRVYTTALSVLTLEVYYRHPPAYLEQRAPISSAAWSRFLANAGDSETRLALDALARCRLEIAEPALTPLLDDREPRIAVAAALGLLELDNPLGAAALEAALPAAAPGARPAIERGLRQARALREGPPPRGVVRVFDPQLGLATLELPRAYGGLGVSIQRDGREVAVMSVAQRFSGSTIVVARLEKGDAPQAGDEALGLARR